jgi:aminoglycoside 6'-N-acetyltransferase I
MEIRELTKDDLFDCAILYKEVFSDEPWNEQWTESRALERLNYLFSLPGFVGLIAKSEIVLAMALGNIEPFHSGPMFSLRELCVKKNFQGKCIGRNLLSALELRLLAAHVTLIHANTDLNTSAAGFYKKLGFIQSRSMGSFTKKYVNNNVSTLQRTD